MKKASADLFKRRSHSHLYPKIGADFFTELRLGSKPKRVKRFAGHRVNIHQIGHIPELHSEIGRKVINTTNTILVGVRQIFAGKVELNVEIEIVDRVRNYRFWNKCIGGRCPPRTVSLSEPVDWKKLGLESVGKGGATFPEEGVNVPASVGGATEAVDCGAEPSHR